MAPSVRHRDPSHSPSPRIPIKKSGVARVPCAPRRASAAPQTIHPGPVFTVSEPALGLKGILMTSFPPVTRRTLLGAGLSSAAIAALTACTQTAAAPNLIGPTSSIVAATEKTRRSTGKINALNLTAGRHSIDLAGKTASTWSFGSIPGATIRVSAGDTIRATLTNTLPEKTSVHWHGVALRNNMDGVPALTQSAIPAGKAFTYDFITEHPGTYWFHPHVGTQLDRGLYGALIVEDPHEPLNYDQDWVVVLDDWLDGVTSTPDQVLKQLSSGMTSMGSMGGMAMRSGNMLMGATSSLLGGDAGDVYYPTFLINGRPPADPETFTGKPGSRVRIRFINAGGDTAFRVALGGHQLTITHTDGYPVAPKEVESVLLGMGERYDIIVTLRDGAFPLVAAAEGKNAAGFAVVRTGTGPTPKAVTTLPELTSSRVGVASLLRADPAVTLASRKPDREITMTLQGGMGKYDWRINGNRYNMTRPLQNALTVRDKERVRLHFVNTTTMWHPMHLHGHTYQHPSGGPRKDTSVVLPRTTLSVDFDADNPGEWLSHCHNVYHGEAGMMTVVAYQR